MSHDHLGGVGRRLGDSNSVRRIHEVQVCSEAVKDDAPTFALISTDNQLPGKANAVVKEQGLGSGRRERGDVVTCGVQFARGVKARARVARYVEPP